MQYGFSRRFRSNLGGYSDQNKLFIFSYYAKTYCRWQKVRQPEIGSGERNSGAKNVDHHFIWHARDRYETLKIS